MSIGGGYSPFVRSSYPRRRASIPIGRKPEGRTEPWLVNVACVGKLYEWYTFKSSLHWRSLVGQRGAWGSHIPRVSRPQVPDTIVAVSITQVVASVSRKAQIKFQSFDS